MNSCGPLQYSGTISKKKIVKRYIKKHVKKFLKQFIKKLAIGVHAIGTKVTQKKFRPLGK